MDFICVCFVQYWILTLFVFFKLPHMKKKVTISDEIVITFGKIIFFIIMYTVLVAVLGLFIYLIFKINPFVDNNPSLSQSLLSAFTNFIAAIFVVHVFRKYVDSKIIRVMYLNIRKFKEDTFLGFITGGGIIIVGFFISYLVGNIDVKLTTTSCLNCILNLIIFLIIAFSEELIFRGYILNKLIEVMSKYWALVISAFIFAFLHIFNPNFSIISFLNIFLAGILLGLLFIRSKSLWAPIIQHFSWNYFQGPIFGYKISGIQTSDTLFVSTINSNNLINGGNFGFEGTLLCLVLQIIFIIFLIIKSKTCLTKIL